jgi:uncharacterized protein (TIGR03083 family)
LAKAARRNLDARVEHCPEWSVADLVWHVTEVHWFWGKIAAERITELPDEWRAPPVRPGDDVLVDGFLTGAEHLVAVLRDAEQSAPCWTWASQKDVAFITRHQVQEAAVHHWDAANAAGVDWTIEPKVAADAIEEFLTFSVSTEDDPIDRPPLAGHVWICPCYDDDLPSWDITDGAIPGTIRWTADDGGRDVDGPRVGAHTDAASALLWLYARMTDHAFFEPSHGDERFDQSLADRFRALCSTD